MFPGVRTIAVRIGNKWEAMTIAKVNGSLEQQSGNQFDVIIIVVEVHYQFILSGHMRRHHSLCARGMHNSFTADLSSTTRKSFANLNG